MAVSGDYAVPVTVNGFTCRNCTDVDYADKHIDPAHPKSGPYGVDAKSDPTQSQAQTSTPNATQSAARTPAVTFGGRLAASAAGPTTVASTVAPASAAVRASAGDGTGSRLDLYA